MNKEIIVRFLQQDIQELEMLTKGFEEMDTFPEAILNLASQKAKNISLNLSKLKEFGQMDFGAFNNEVAENNSEEKHYALRGEKNDEVKEEESKETFVVSENSEVEILNTTEEFAETIEEKDTESVRDETHKMEVIDLQETEHIEEVQETKTVEESLPKKQTLEESLNSQPIDDIRNALSIGDRFRFQRELFNNNGELMNKMIAYLNKLANYEEAEKFLKRKFNWADDNPDAEDFLKIVKRRY